VTVDDQDAVSHELSPQRPSDGSVTPDRLAVAPGYRWALSGAIGSGRGVRLMADAYDPSTAAVPGRRPFWSPGGWGLRFRQHAMRRSATPADLPEPAELETRARRSASSTSRSRTSSTPGIRANVRRPTSGPTICTSAPADAIRSQLLFAEHEPYSHQKVAETGGCCGVGVTCTTRGSGHLLPPDDHTVDLHVRVRDV
jgi:hypothetical protein